MRSLFDQDAMEDILSRLDHLEENTKADWGKMSVGQMAWHCQIPLKVALKNKPPKKRPNPLIALFFKKSLYNDKPWRKGLPTAPFAKATEPKDLKEELLRLRELVKEATTTIRKLRYDQKPQILGPSIMLDAALPWKREL